MISDQLRRFASAYPTLRSSNFGYNDDTRLITESAPSELYNSLGVDSQEYLIKGSVGQGSWADIPWIAIMHKGITTTTQTGYYIAILFKHDMSGVYVSLGLGWTQFRERFGNKTGRSKVRAYAEMLRTQLPPNTVGDTGEINLRAVTPLGRGYEVANIVASPLAINGLTDDKLLGTLQSHLGHYQEVMDKYGADLFYDFESEAQDELPELNDFRQQVKKRSLRVDKSRALLELKSISDTQPPGKKKVYVSQIIRNSAFANFVKDRAKYVCEVCGQEPFLKKNGQPYAEADHVEPLFEKGVDHPDNMRCLCPQCHRVITYGSDAEVSKIFAA